MDNLKKALQRLVPKMPSSSPPSSPKAEESTVHSPMKSPNRLISPHLLAKRIAIRNDPEEFNSSIHDYEKIDEKVEKSAKTKNFLFLALKEHFLMAHLKSNDLSACIDIMFQRSLAAGENIISQGDTGTEFYVLEEGRAEIFVDDELVGKYGPGSCFGELALMYNCKRAATVKAIESAAVYVMPKKQFRKLLATTATSKIIERCEFLKKISIFSALTNEQINKIADAFEEVEFKGDEYIIRQGEQGNTFYIIQQGEVECTQFKNLVEKSESHLLTLKQGDYFGEMALMLEEPRGANCIARSESVRCLSMDRKNFFALLGPLQMVLQINMRLRILKSVPLLSKLTDDELNRVADSLVVQSFENNDYIIRQGEDGSTFYIINEGEVKCTLTTPGSGEEKELMRFSKGDYFGERALLKNEPRGANVIADGYVDCLVLERKDFDHLLGPLEKIIEREVNRREEIGDEIVGGPIKRKSREQVPYEMLKKLGLLGSGTFGRVYLVKHVKNGNMYALKSMMKYQIARSHQQRNIMNEKNILFGCDHPMILDLISTYNTKNELLMLTEIILGGELWNYIYQKQKKKCLKHTHLGGYEKFACQFYSGIVILCFQYLHKMNVAYRDLKPENLLVCDDGYMKMIDFGFAKRIPYRKGNSMQVKSFTLCGTPDYLAPELVLSRGHDKSVDYWALGCFLYELIMGKTPFTDAHQSEIFKKIVRSDRYLQFPYGFDKEAEDLVRCLLNPNPALRMGNLNKGTKDITSHKWFSDFDFDMLYEKQYPSPFQPNTKNPLDSCSTMKDNACVIQYTGSQKIFDGF